jgi:hypothetical protein
MAGMVSAPESRGSARKSASPRYRRDGQYATPKNAKKNYDASEGEAQEVVTVLPLSELLTRTAREMSAPVASAP